MLELVASPSFSFLSRSIVPSTLIKVIRLWVPQSLSNVTSPAPRWRSSKFISFPSSPWRPHTTAYISSQVLPYIYRRRAKGRRDSEIIKSFAIPMGDGIKVHFKSISNPFPFVGLWYENTSVLFFHFPEKLPTHSKNMAWCHFCLPQPQSRLISSSSSRAEALVLILCSSLAASRCGLDATASSLAEDGRPAYGLDFWWWTRGGMAWLINAT